MSSVAIAIREAVFDRLKDISDYKRTRKTRLRQLQPEDLPSLSVLVVTEDHAPDGDANVGEPRFISDITIGVSVFRSFDTPDSLDDKLDDDVASIQTVLLTDPTFVKFGPSALFESVSRMVTRRREVQAGGSYAIELQLEMTFQTRVSFEPNIPDHYKGNTITARPLQSPDAPTVTIKIDEKDWT